MIRPVFKARPVLPTISPATMTPEVAALLAFAKETLRLRNEAFDEGVALRRELTQLQQAKKRAMRSSK